jgi:hypothetical protein
MPDRRRTGPELYALVAEFNRPEALKNAVERARKHGFTRIEAFSPFPIEGLAESLGFREHTVAPVMLAGAIGGAAIGFLLQVGANLDFPLNIGGRPVISVPAFILITFELMVLGAVCSVILAMLLLNRLPRLHHPLFEIDSFHFATADKFFLAILADDAEFDRTKVRRFLKSLDPVTIEAAGYAETAP